MLGITYHNPATISVFLDRMRFRDCFISAAELQAEEWKRKLKSFVDLPSDGRERVVFIESFGVLQTLLQKGADFTTVKVAVYDDCDVLSKVPGAQIVDARINGSEQDTWQLYTVSFGEFNDALASQPAGVPGLLRDYEMKEDSDLPDEPKVVKQEAQEVEETEPEEKKETPGSVLVMEQILDDIEADDDDDVEETVVEPTSTPEPASVAMPEPARVVVPKREPMEVEPATAEEIVEELGVTEAERKQATEIVEKAAPKAKAKQKRAKKKALKHYELF